MSNKNHEYTVDEAIKELTKDGDIYIEFIADKLEPKRKDIKCRIKKT